MLWLYCILAILNKPLLDYDQSILYSLLKEFDKLLRKNALEEKADRGNKDS
jgi:hypothetical protein